jgi:pimeloyl-ACP methyl ester carboxylesterase
MTHLTQFTREGLVFDITDSGPSTGMPVVLLHGFPTDRTSWDAVVPLLHDAGFRTLAPDQRGYSPRARPKGRGAYVMTELVDDVVALLDAAEVDRAHVVGHDWGGAVAWLLAGNRPDRVASLTALSTPHPAAMRRAFSSVDQARRSWYMAAFQVPWVPERVVPLGLGRMLRDSGLPATAADHYVARMREPGALEGGLNWYRAMPLNRGTSHRVRVPTTYVWGSKDFALGRHAAMLTREHVPGDYRFRRARRRALAA